MQFRQAITCFCFLVLTFQLLPVRQLGALLFGNAITEELPHGDDSPSKDCKDKLCFKKEFTHSHSFAVSSFIQTGMNQYIHFSIALPFPLAGDVQTPPPNIA